VELTKAVSFSRPWRDFFFADRPRHLLRCVPGYFQSRLRRLVHGIPGKSSAGSVDLSPPVRL
jgi:hypothetical protein